MSEEQKSREETQPMPQQAPAQSENKDTAKVQSEPQHSFHDWASI